MKEAIESNLPLAGPIRWLLIALWVIWAGLLVFGFLFGTPNSERTRRLALPVRMGMSVVLVVSALVWWRAGTVGTALATYGLLIFLGMTFGFLGDLFMARVIPTFNEVIFGILAFGIGHICYILAILQVGMVLDLDSGRSQLILLIAFWGAAIFLWLRFVRTPSRPAIMNAGTLVYSLLLSGMTALTFALAWQAGRLWPLALGGLSFLASDLILGNQIMRGSRWYLISDVVWATYTVGQMLIVFSTGIALNLPG